MARENPGVIDSVAYPIAIDDKGDLIWQTVRVMEEQDEIWDDFSLGMGETRRASGRGYLFAEGFDASQQGALHLSPFYHKLNINQLGTGAGYFFEAKGSSQTATLDSANKSSGTATDSTLTIAHTVAAGDSRILVCTISYDKGSTSVINSLTVTYAGLPLTHLGHGRITTGGIGNDGFTAAIRYLVNPPVGTANLVITINTSASIAAGVYVFTGSDTNSPWRNSAAKNGTSATASVTLPSASNDVVLDVLATGRSGATVTATDDVPDEIYNVNILSGPSTAILGAGSKEAGAANVTASWALSASLEWVTMAASLKPVANTQYVYAADSDKVFKFKYDSDAGITEVTADTGTSSGTNGSTTLNDTTKAWGVNAYANNLLAITGGVGSGQRRIISSNTATQLTVSVAWAIVPDATSTYSILASTYFASATAGDPLYANGKWYVPMGSGTNARRLDTITATLDTWADAGWTAVHLATFQQGVTPSFARANATTVNAVNISTDTGNLTTWGGDNKAGDSSTAITRLVEAQGQLYVMKEDNLYETGTENESRPVIPFLNRGRADADNGKGGYAFGDSIFYPSGPLWRYRIGHGALPVGVDTIRSFRTVEDVDFVTPKNRRHYWVTSAGEWLYVQLNSETRTALIAMRKRREGDPSGHEMIFHEILDIPLSKGMALDSNNRLWIKGASVLEDDRDIRVIELDINGTTDVTNRRGQADTTHTIWLDERDGGRADELKQLRLFVVSLENWDSNAPLVLQIYRDNGDSGEIVGQQITADSVSTQTWTPGQFDTAYRVRPKLNAVTNASYTPRLSDPQILWVRVRFRFAEIVRIVIPADDLILSPYGLRATQVEQSLRRLQNKGVVTMRRPGDTSTFSGEIVSVTDTMYGTEKGTFGHGFELTVKRWATP